MVTKIVNENFSDYDQLKEILDYLEVLEKDHDNRRTLVSVLNRNSNIVFS